MAENEWDLYAPQYDEEADHGLRDPLVRQKWLDLILAQIPTAYGHVIDMGGGTGSITEILAEAGHHVTYVDSSPEMTKLARLKCQRFGDQVRFFTCSIDNLDAEIFNSNFDVVFGRHILWVSDDLPGILKLWHSLLKTDGCFVLVEGFWSTGSGISAKELQSAVMFEMGGASVVSLNDPQYWGKKINDERYLLTSKSL